jgi:hypothetical protein
MTMKSPEPRARLISLTASEFLRGARSKASIKAANDKPSFKSNRATPSP